MADSKFIIHGNPEVEGPLHLSFSQYMYRQLKSGGKNIAQINCATGEYTTYAEILQKACNLAVSLCKLGIKKGDVVCLSSENRFEFSICALAVLFVGAVNATLNVLYSRYELIHAMNISQPKIVFCTDFTLYNILDAVEDIPSVQKVILIGDQPSEPNVILFKELLIDYVDVDSFKVTKVGIHDPLVVLCSSGTTGLPKGVLLTHHNFSICTGHLKDMLMRGKKARQVCILTIMPWFHAYGFVTHMILLNLNVKYVFLVKFEEEPFLKAIQDYKVTMTMLVPPLMVFLAKHPLVDKYNLSSLDEIWCGAAPLSRDLQEAVTNRIGVYSIKQGYGLTETTLAVTHTDVDNCNRYGSCGKVVPGTQVKIIDIKTGEALGPHKTGELCAKGPLMMAGYYRNEAANREIFDSEGWLHTGDIAYYDEDGYFFVVDRLKELIKYKGFQVPPAELEAIILQIPKVKDVAVVGLPDETSGELPLAFVVKQANIDVTEKEIIDFVASRVSAPKRLHGGVIFVDEIPKNPSGKILRRELRDYLKKYPKSKL